MSITPPIVGVRVAGLYVVEASFADGVSVALDLGPFLRANADHQAIGAFLDPERFGSVEVVGGDLAWGDDWDLLLSAATVGGRGGYRRGQSGRRSANRPAAGRRQRGQA